MYDQKEYTMIKKKEKKRNSPIVSLNITQISGHAS